MAQLIGREREMASALDLFRVAKTTPVPRVLLVEGASGIGKSAFVGELAARLRPEAVVVKTAAFRIQSTVPFAVASRLCAQIAEELGGDLARYLPGEQADKGLELLALLEGVTLDRPVVLVADDVQWADAESLEAISRSILALASCPLFVIVSQRDDEGPVAEPFDIDGTIVVRPLDATSARRLALECFPSAAPEVADAIVARAEGMPIDILAISEEASHMGAKGAEDVAMSTRAVIAKRIRSSNAALRNFLQISSLLPEPIEYGLLARLWPDSKQLNAFIQASERYLVQEGDTLGFRHAIVGEAIVETIAVKIPLHRRIIEAVSTVPELRIQDRLLISEQALAAGDRQLAQESLLALALFANDGNLVRMAIDASEKHMELGDPPDATFITFYENFAKALTFVSMNSRAERVISHALLEARRRNLAGVGSLVAQLILAQWYDDRQEAAIITYKHYLSEFHDPLDLVMVQAAAMWFHVSTHDVESLAKTIASLRTSSIPLPPPVQLRIEIAQVYVDCRSGDYTNARARLPLVSSAAHRVHSSLANYAEFVNAFVDYTQFGPLKDQRFQALLEHDPRNPAIIYFRNHSLLHQSRLDDVSLITEDILRRSIEPNDRSRMLAFIAAIDALRNSCGPHWKSIETEALRYAAGDHQTALHSLALWASASEQLDKTASSRILDAVIPSYRTPQDPVRMAWSLPIPFAARRLSRADILRAVADGTAFWDDREPVIQAERAAARTIAAHLAGLALAEPLEQVAARCEGFGLQLARDLMIATCGRGVEKASAIKGLQAQGIVWSGDAPAQKSSPGATLTARERQISELISNGLTNKEIAEQLVLSERTVEGHVANIFNKLGVSSRTQIAAWFLTQVTAVR